MATYYIIANAEASSNLARYDGVRYGFRAEATDLREMYRKTRPGRTWQRSETAHTARHVCSERRLLRGLLQQGSEGPHTHPARFSKAYESVDLILTPTTPNVAFKIGEKISDPLAMYLNDIFTITCNLSGLPGISIPCGRNTAGLPIGLQLMANHFQEGLLLRAAHQFER